MNIGLAFVPGSGGGGRDAWPTLTARYPDAAYLDLDAVAMDRDPVDATVDLILAATSDGTIVVAHSFGAIAATLAAAREPTRIGALVLVEPALYSLARGGPAVEEAVARLDPIYARRTNLAPTAFYSELMTALTGRPTAQPTESDDIAAATRFAASRAPWAYEPDPAVFGVVPTTVVTGAWNAEYEEIAAALRTAGARHVTLEGFGHRAQDHPDFASVVDAAMPH